jgi:hypothetical protein
MNPYMAQQGTPLLGLQNSPQLVSTQAPAPYTPYVAPAQTFDISSLINLIIPIMGLGMVMSIMGPMMRGMSEGFGK